MSLWQFNACCRAYNQMQEQERKRALVRAWQTANWTGAAFAGKLKPLKHYIGETPVIAPKVTREQQEAIDRRFEERRWADGT